MTDTDSGNIVVANATNDLNDTSNDVDEDAFSTKKIRGKGRSYLLDKFYSWNYFFIKKFLTKILFLKLNSDEVCINKSLKINIFR